MSASDRADVGLLVEQKNQVFRALERFGFDPRDFRWDVVRGRERGPTIDRLVHSSSEYFFAFDAIPAGGLGFSDDRRSYYSPAPDRRGGVYTDSFGWDGQLEVFQSWLGALRSETGTVSLWDTLGSQSARDLATADLSNRPLTNEERQHIVERIEQVRIYLKSTVTDQEALNRIDNKLDYLIESSKRLGVKDFANLALGVLMTLGIEAALDVHRAQEVVNLFLSGMRVLLGH